MKVIIVKNDCTIVVGMESESMVMSMGRVPGRCATIATPYGRTVIAKAADWKTYVVTERVGFQFSDEQLDSILQEVADANVPDDTPIVVTRPEPESVNVSGG